MNTKTQIGLKMRELLDRPFGRPLLGTMAAVGSIKTRGGYTPTRYRAGQWIHKCPDGHYLIDRMVNFSDSVTKQIASTHEQWFHQYDPAIGDVIVDIGAGVGSETAAMSQAVGATGKVFAFEAHPQTYQCLQQFVQMNQFDNVIALNVAVSDRAGTVSIQDELSDHLSNSIVLAGGGVQVAAMTLDQVMAQHGVAQVAFIKMNIEGAETLAIGGMRETIKKTRQVCFSCHDFRAEVEPGRDELRTRNVVQQFLLDNDFEVTRRLDDARPWVVDQLYGVNRALAG